jgi:hypothetical protein
MGVNPDTAFLKELTQVSFQPVFILGLHRSGTSILYKMLTATGNFNPVTAYHLINYNELLSNQHLKKETKAKERLTHSLKEKGLQDRGIDRLKVTADFAEEYGFLLNRQNFQMYLTRKNLMLFIEMCKKIQYLARNNKPILLKNPYDFPNFLFIKQVFPNARFVFIHRDPLKTISSTLNAMKTILVTKHPYMALLSPIYEKFSKNPLLMAPLRFIFCTVPEFGVVLITRITANATKYYLKNIEKLPKADYISITYEGFCEHPKETIESILRRFSLDMNEKIDAQSFIKQRKADIDRSVQKLTPYISHSMKNYFDIFQYTVE